MSINGFDTTEDGAGWARNVFWRFYHHATASAEEALV